MHLRSQNPGLFGGVHNPERELDAEHLFIQNQSSAIAVRLQVLIDEWTANNSYLEEEEGDSDVDS